MLATPRHNSADTTTTGTAGRVMPRSAARRAELIQSSGVRIQPNGAKNNAKKRERRNAPWAFIPLLNRRLQFAEQNLQIRTSPSLLRASASAGAPPAARRRPILRKDRHGIRSEPRRASPTGRRQNS